MKESSTYVVRGDDGVEYGPVDLRDLRDWARENRVGLGTQLCREEEPDHWQSWQQFPELVALLAEVRASGSMLPPLPEAVPVLAPMGRRSLALVLDLLLASILVILPLGALYWLQPEPLIIRQAEYSIQVWQAVLQGVNPPEASADIATWYPWWDRILSFVLPLLYFAGFHAAHGRTPAKSLLRLRVVDAQGQKPTLPMALLRGLILMICVNLYGVPLLYAFFNPQRRALHDIVAGTYVVER